MTELSRCLLSKWLLTAIVGFQCTSALATIQDLSSYNFISNCLRTMLSGRALERPFSVQKQTPFATESRTSEEIEKAKREAEKKKEIVAKHHEVENGGAESEGSLARVHSLLLLGLVLLLSGGALLGIRYIFKRRNAIREERNAAGNAQPNSSRASVQPDYSYDTARSGQAGSMSAEDVDDGWRPKSAVASKEAPASELRKEPTLYKANQVSGEVRNFSVIVNTIGNGFQRKTWSFSLVRYDRQSGERLQHVAVEAGPFSEGLLNDGDHVVVYGKFRNGVFHGKRLKNASANATYEADKELLGVKLSLILLPLIMFCAFVAFGFYAMTHR